MAQKTPGPGRQKTVITTSVIHGMDGMLAINASAIDVASKLTALEIQLGAERSTKSQIPTQPSEKTVESIRPAAGDDLLSDLRPNGVSSQRPRSDPAALLSKFYST
jgi:hypothetical protein